MVTTYTPVRSLRSSTQRMLVVPRTKLKTFGDRAFSVASPSVWNYLPSDIKDSGSLYLFKNKLKTHLFCMAYDISVIYNKCILVHNHVSCHIALRTVRVLDFWLFKPLLLCTIVQYPSILSFYYMQPSFIYLF